MSQLLSSMAGNLYKVLVKMGDRLEPGEEVAILESMKMEIPITTETAGTVKELKVSEGDFVNEGDVILVLE
ncbi:acetyl-CoA carboxylase biotin carboxyl carrier protein subunit [Neobacillus sp. FSL H8-0543]|uniref:acetyl-CoA carboxylase biotin carboxyl carrier protein subunit n=1 Tax=Neobacillus sp. FSL H8-0543 TaxID=2954672 RepID=UPI00315923F9